AAFSATGNHAGRGRFGIETTIARPAKMGRENAGLAFETENGTVDIRLLEQDAGVVGQVTGREIIGAVDDDIILGDDLHRIFAAETCVMDDNFTGWIDAEDGFLGG